MHHHPMNRNPHPAARRTRGLSVALSAMLIAGVIVASPAFAGKKTATDTTTSTSTSTTTSTTTAPKEPDTFTQWEDASALSGRSAGQYPGSMYWITSKVTGAVAFWNASFTGAGVDIALIDTGVVPVDGLRRPGKVINGPALSFESQADSLRYLDTYGHGTHLTGIIAGRSDDATTVTSGNSSSFVGMAPGARIVNVKVADSHGAVDLSRH